MVAVKDTARKLLREADLALVVYRGHEIIGVKHSPVGPWLAWDRKLRCWIKALSEAAKRFELLPLAGHIDN